MDTTEFNAIFWLTVIGAFLGFGGLVLQACLKSRCSKIKVCGLECERPESANAYDVDLDVPEFNSP
jgi:hypothetical protein